MGEIREIDLTQNGALRPSTLLWRYVPLRTLFVYLPNRVFVPSLNTLRENDPFEGRFYYDDHPSEFNGALTKRYGEQADKILDWIYTDRLKDWQRKSVLNPDTQLRDYNNSLFPEHYFEFVRETRFAWCWFNPSNAAESAAMWNTYGKDGVAVVTTVERLTAALKKTGRDFEYGQLKYLEVSPYGVINPKLQFSAREFSHDEVMLCPHFFKRAEYQSENEIRFVTVEAPRTSGGIILDLDATEWIKTVKLWPGLSATEADALKQVIASKLPKATCERSSMLREVYQDEVDSLASNYLETIWNTSSDSDWRMPADLKRLWATNP